MTDRRGLFVALEGPDGSGKSTQARSLCEHLRTLGYDVVQTREPGGTRVGEALRAIVLDPDLPEIADTTEALLYAAARAQHVAEVIAPALARGAVVVTDRYVDSSLAYQGVGRDLDRQEVADVNAFATRHLLPDLTVLLDVGPEVGLERVGASQDRLEAQPIDFHVRVRQAYLDFVAADPGRYVVVDAEADAESVQKAVRDAVLARLGAQS